MDTLFAKSSHPIFNACSEIKLPVVSTQDMFATMSFGQSVKMLRTYFLGRHITNFCAEHSIDMLEWIKLENEINRPPDKFDDNFWRKFEKVFKDVSGDVFRFMALADRERRDKWEVGKRKDITHRMMEGKIPTGKEYHPQYLQIVDELWLESDPNTVKYFLDQTDTERGKV